MPHRCELSVEQGTITTPKLQLQLAVKGASPDIFNLGWALFPGEENTFQTLFFLFLLCFLNLKNNKMCDHVLFKMLFRFLLPLHPDWICKCDLATFVRIAFPSQCQQWSLGLCYAAPRWDSCVCLRVSSVASESPLPPPRLLIMS